MKITPQQKRKYLRRGLLGLLVLFTAMAQNVLWLPVIYGARALPLLPLVVAIAIYDQPVPAIIYGALAGAAWDVSSASGGYHAIYLAIAAFACAMGMRYFLNKNFFTVLLLAFAVVSIYLIVHWFTVFAVLPNLTPAQITLPLLREALPSLGYTMLLAPLCFTLVSIAVRRTSRRQRRVKAE